jgi:hypothetical protein
MRILVPGGILERVSFPGAQRDYYRVRPSAWVDLARRLSTQYSDLKKLAEDGLRMLGDAPAARRERLRDVHALYDWRASEDRLATRRLNVARSTRG